MTRAAPVAPRGDRRRQRTRSAIMTAGQQLFAARAAEGVTIDEIVAAANVAKGSFYNHFDDKDALISAIVELVHGDCEFRIYAANRDVADPAERVVRALCVMIDYAARHPERLQAMMSLSARRLVSDSPLNAGLSDDLRRGLAATRFPGLTLEAGLIVVVGLTSTAMGHVIADPTASPAHVLAETVGARLLQALGLTSEEAVALASAAANDILQEKTR